MQERLPIFRAGTHRDDKGRTWTFSEADVASIAANYDPALCQAPHVLGHPTAAAPAWGWTTGLEVEGGILYETREKVPTAFSEAVDDGRYRYRSASLYEPNDPANPKPGSWYLKHVGWLGAVPPSIKGLGPAFSEGDPGEGVTFDLSFAETDLSLAWLAGNVADMSRRLRDWFIEKFGLEAADRAVPAWNDQAAASIASDVRNVIRTENGEGISAAFAEAQTALAGATAATALLDSRAADLDVREAAIADREAKATADQVSFAETARTTARADDTAFVDQLVEQGRLPPGHADQVKTLMAVLDGDGAVSFSEGQDGPRDQFRALLQGLGTAIHFGEFAPPEGARFAEGRSAEEHARVISEVMAEASATGRSISAAEAASIARNR